MNIRPLFLSLLVAGCGNGTTGSMDLGSDGKKPAEVCTPDGKPIALSGQYGVQANLLVNVKVIPGCAGGTCVVNADANAELLLIATVTQTGNSATMTARPCKIVIPPVALKGGNKPVILSASKTLVSSVKEVTAASTLDSMVTCANFNAMPITIALGANLANPSNDPLPMYLGATTKFCGGAAPGVACLTNTSPAPSDTACVCDQDGDAKLGASLDAMNAPGFDDIDKVYVDLRTSVTLAGQIFPAAAGQTNAGPRIKGTVAGLKLDQNVLGCHRNLAAPSTPRDCDDSETTTVAGFNPAVTQSTNGDSTFIAVPLAAGDTCDTLIANESALFQ